MSDEQAEMMVHKQIAEAAKFLELARPRMLKVLHDVVVEVNPAMSSATFVTGVLSLFSHLTEDIMNALGFTPDDLSLIPAEEVVKSREIIELENQFGGGPDVLSD